MKICYLLRATALSSRDFVAFLKAYYWVVWENIGALNTVFFQSSYITEAAF